MKKLFILSSFFIAALSANAHIWDDDADDDPFSGVTDYRKSAVYLGFKGAGNYSMMTDYEDENLDIKPGLGFEGGVVIGMRFGKFTKGSDPGTGRVALQFEPTYVQHTISTCDKDLKLSYFEVPVLFKVFLTPSFNIELGPNVCIPLSSSPDLIESGSSLIHTGDLKGYDVKGCAGVCLQGKALFASLRYNYGFSDLADNFPCKVSSLNLTVGLNFNVFKF